MDKELSDEELIELGRRSLIMNELKTWGELRAAARAEADEITERIKRKLKELEDDGHLNTSRSNASGKIEEGELAEVLKVDRMTVRGWLGKQRRKPAAKVETGTEALT